MLGRVIGMPGLAIGCLPFGIAHARVMGNAVIEIVFVEIGIHPHLLAEQRLVILGAGQRRQKEELEEIDRQFALDDFDIAQDRFLGIVRKAENIAGIGGAAMVAPFLQHQAVFGDLVLPLLGGEKIVGIDVLKSDEDPVDAGARRLLDEIGNAMTKCVDLDDQLDFECLPSRASGSAGRTAIPIPCCGRNCRR